MIFFSVIFALIVDKVIGEPKRFHPLVGFGCVADTVEKRFNQSASKLVGVFSYIIIVFPCVIASILISEIVKHNFWIDFFTGVFFLYLAVGWQSLIEHAENISKPLAIGNIDNSRQALAMIVSRDTHALEEKDIAKAATESVLENGADAIFCAIFWFCLFGIPGVVLYRLSNTLDAMWGYKNEQYIQFGWFSARVDDGLNFIPARLTALSYALCGNTKNALHYWRQQAEHWKSPNAGPVMSAGAGALNVSLGGTASYHGVEQSRPILGPNESKDTQADAKTIQQACHLLNKSLVLWMVMIGISLLLNGLLQGYL